MMPSLSRRPQLATPRGISADFRGADPSNFHCVLEQELAKLVDRAGKRRGGLRWAADSILLTGPFCFGPDLVITGRELYQPYSIPHLHYEVRSVTERPVRELAIDLCGCARKL